MVAGATEDPVEEDVLSVDANEKALGEEESLPRLNTLAQLLFVDVEPLKKPGESRSAETYAKPDNSDELVELLGEGVSLPEEPRETPPNIPDPKESFEAEKLPLKPN